jgi:hypothetical protein
LYLFSLTLALSLEGERAGFSGEAVSKCSILFKIKEGENLNHTNTLSVSRIKI